MTPDERSTGRIREWLADTAAGVGDPTRGIDDVLDRVSTTHQRRSWRRWSWRAGDDHVASAPRRARRTWRLAGLAIAVAGVGTGLIAATLLVQRTEPRTIVVAQDGSGDATTIGDGVALAADGDTVLVRPGTYVERVHVARTIAIAGDGPRAEIIVRSPADGTTLPDGRPASVAFDLDGHAATLRGLTIVGGGRGRAVVVENGATPTITEVVIDVDGIVVDESVAIWWSTGAGGVLRDSTVSGTIVISGAGTVPLIERNTLPRTCLHVTQEGSADPPLPIIRGNQMGGCPSGNLINAKGGDLTIEDNHLELEHGKALNLSGVMGATIRDNEVHGSAVGVSIVNPRGPVTLAGNTIWANEVGVFVVNGHPDVHIESNTIRDNAVGLNLAVTTDVVVTGNALCGNGQDIRVSPADLAVPSLEANDGCALPGASATP